MMRLLLLLPLVSFFGCGQQQKWDKSTKPAKFELKRVIDASDPKNMVLDSEVLLDNGDVYDTSVILDCYANPNVSLKIKSSSKKKFISAMEKNVGNQVAILLDDRVMCAPTVKSPPPTQNVDISFPKPLTNAEAHNVAAGILKYRDTISEEQAKQSKG